MTKIQDRQKARKIWEKNFGPIPVDENGFSYEIHHINGDSNDNRKENLACLSIQEHHDTHFKQGDYGAAWAISCRMKNDEYKKENVSRNSKLSNQKRIKNGTHHWLKKNRDDYHNTDNPETRKKISQSNNRLNSRQIVGELRKEIERTQKPLGSGWTKKSESFLKEKLLEYKRLPSVNTQENKKLQSISRTKIERENVADLRELSKFAGCSLGSGWVRKSDEWIEEHISIIEKEIINAYRI